MRQSKWKAMIVAAAALALLVVLPAVAGGVQGKGDQGKPIMPPSSLAAETIYNASPAGCVSPAIEPEDPAVRPEGIIRRYPTLTSGGETIRVPEAIGKGGPGASTPLAPAAVLWDQPLSSVNQNAYVNQEFPDFPTFSSFLADDFVNPVQWTIGKIFVPGNGWNGFSSLTNATSLTWSIYADMGLPTRPEGAPVAPGIPDGYPGYGTPVWTLTLAPGDPQVTLATGTGGYLSDTLLTLSTPFDLPPGHYWLVFYPTMGFGCCGQFGRQPADTLNGDYGQFINPGGGFGYGTYWQNWGVLGAVQQDIAFRLEGVTCTGTLYTGTYDNGPLVTHPGGGYGGADASVLQTAIGLNTYGFGNQYSYGYRMADDFTITNPEGWDIGSIEFYAYQTGSSTTSTITGIYYQIWNGPPNDPGSSVVFGDMTTNRLVSSVWSNIYRVVDYDVMASNRPIMANTVSCATHLAPGTYWLDWTTNGSLSSGPWAPPISIVGQTTTGNALQFTTAWAGAIDTGSALAQQSMPFKVNWSYCVTCMPIYIDPAVLPTPILGVPYSVTLVASGGTGPYTFAVTAGTLPTGLTLSPTGLLSGTMTALTPSSFTITATDTSSGCTGEQAYSLSTFSAFFKDDMGRSQMCVNRLTGAFTYQVLSGPGMGTYTGTCVVMNSGAKYINPVGAPFRLNMTYDPIRKKAAGYYITAVGAYSALADANTANNTGGCNGTIPD